MLRLIERNNRDARILHRYFEAPEVACFHHWMSSTAH
jgi:hypothetical protein